MAWEILNSKSFKQEDLVLLNWAKIQLLVNKKKPQLLLAT